MVDGGFRFGLRPDYHQFRASHPQPGPSGAVSFGDLSTSFEGPGVPPYTLAAPPDGVTYYVGPLLGSDDEPDVTVDDVTSGGQLDLADGNSTSGQRQVRRILIFFSSVEVSSKCELRLG